MTARRDIPLICDLDRPGHGSHRPSGLDVDAVVSRHLPPAHRRATPPNLPEVSEPEVVRHYVELSTLNHHIDKAPYPLGSCTMKYNPKLNEEIGRMAGFADLHPFAPEADVQGAFEVMVRLSRALVEVTGMDDVSLEPAAGAQGELLGILIARAHHTRRGDPRKYVLIPDSAHGTNPATVRMAGYQAREVKSDRTGRAHVADFRRLLGPDVAAIMVTNPNTLGLFETEIEELCRAAHEAGALMYMDGANLNALLGIARPGDMGFDMVHINLHKTFSTPHGGGGPGGGPLAVKAALAPFLPSPRVVPAGDGFALRSSPDSVGKLHSFHGNFGVMLRALAYVLRLGGDGLAEVSREAILNANYLMHRLKEKFEIPYPGHCMHEFVLSGSRQKKLGVSTADMAKRLLDFGVHAPTVYFPLIVSEALMVEPTETETLDRLDQLADAFLRVAAEAETSPDLVGAAPHETPVGRLDEVTAAREPRLSWQDARETA
jgi:glycine dehydrogenase subunit 2